MITRYTTQSGGVYEVDDRVKKFRKVTAGEHSTVPPEWTDYIDVIYPFYEERLRIKDKPSHGWTTTPVVSVQLVLMGGDAPKGV